jgi:son of sevenless
MQTSVDQLQANNRALKTYINEITTQLSFDQDGIQWVSSPSSGHPEVHAGTVEKLIELLYNQDQLSVSEYVDAFLLTHRSFTTSEVVFDTLENVYLDSSGESAEELGSLSVHAPVGNADGQEDWRNKIREEQQQMTHEKTRLRIVVILKRWITEYIRDFDPNLLHRFRAFTGQVPGSADFDPQRDLLHKVLNQAEQGMAELADQIDEPHGLANAYGYGETFNSVAPEVLAQQITALEIELYGRISPKELLNLGWQKADKDIRSPRLLSMIRFFNFINNAFQTALLCDATNSGPNPTNVRVKRMQFLLRVAQEFIRLNNFNGLFEVSSVFNSSPIVRLYKTQQLALEKSKFKQIYAKIEKLTSTENNLRAYRDALRDASAAGTLAIPYVGVHLSDLTFVEAGNPDTVHFKPPEGGAPRVYVNFSKRRKVAEVMATVLQHQRLLHTAVVRKDPAITAMIEVHQPVSDEALFQRSLEAEPRT